MKAYSILIDLKNYFLNLVCSSWKINNSLRLACPILINLKTYFLNLVCSTLKKLNNLILACPVLIKWTLKNN